MFENLLLSATKVPNSFVVIMGVGTVFIGLLCIILICKIMSLLCAGVKTDKKGDKVANAPVANTQNQVIENRQEIIAAVCAAAAEDMGTDISGIRVHSFKKI